jgi:hypothetical protein
LLKNLPTALTLLWVALHQQQEHIEGQLPNCRSNVRQSGEHMLAEQVKVGAHKLGGQFANLLQQTLQLVSGGRLLELKIFLASVFVFLGLSWLCPYCLLARIKIAKEFQLKNVIWIWVEWSLSLVKGLTNEFQWKEFYLPFWVNLFMLEWI